MALSKFDTLVTAIQTQMGDSSVLFGTGTVSKIQGRTNQKRRIIFERSHGSARPSSAPSRPGTKVTNVTKHARLEREETIVVTVSAEDEQLTDQLFDNLLNAIFDVMGPNALVENNRFEWAAKDSKGGGYVVRQPVIIFEMVVRLRVDPPIPLSQVILNTTYTQVIHNPQV